MCGKSYGFLFQIKLIFINNIFNSSEGSLNQHLKLKHPDYIRRLNKE